MPPERTCDYCDGTNLVYRLESGRGPVNRCIPCLAVEQGQQQLRMPFEKFIDTEDYGVVYETREDLLSARRGSYEKARDWFRVLARIFVDEPVLMRAPDDFGTVNDHTRSFLTNIMGEDAHKPPSVVAEEGGGSSD